MYRLVGSFPFVELNLPADKEIENIVVTIPFSKNCSGTNLTSKVGTVTFDEHTKVFLSLQAIVHSFLRFASGESPIYLRTLSLF